MKCPYQDIGCWYIDDVSHECEARSRRDCRHEAMSEPQDSRKEVEQFIEEIKDERRD